MSRRATPRKNASNSVDPSIITDDNIHHYVQLYLKHKNNKKLPEVLRNNISNWDVSRVTNMSRLFFRDHLFLDNNFNETLNWDVSNVRNMDFLFDMCHNFNNGGVPLNWNVSNVESMNYMFNSCSRFNQPLVTNNNPWDVSNVKSMHFMFANC